MWPQSLNPAWHRVRANFRSPASADGAGLAAAAVRFAHGLTRVKVAMNAGAQFLPPSSEYASSK